MTKLLEYKKPTPSEGIEGLTTGAAAIADALESDVWMSLTTDTPALRYNGPQYVFLWDHTRFTEWFEDEDLEKGVDYQVSFWNACTKHSFLPIKNNNVTKSNYPYYLHKTVNWYDRVEQGVTDKFRGAEPAPVVGRIFTVGLAALHKLDEFYSNGYTHRRVRTPVRSIMSVENSIKDCWIYFTTYDAFGKYDPHTSQYKSTHGIEFDTVAKQGDKYGLRGSYTPESTVG